MGWLKWIQVKTLCFLREFHQLNMFNNPNQPIHDQMVRNCYFHFLFFLDPNTFRVRYDVFSMLSNKIVCSVAYMFSIISDACQNLNPILTNKHQIVVYKLENELKSRVQSVLEHFYGSLHFECNYNTIYLRIFYDHSIILCCFLHELETFLNVTTSTQH